MLAENVSDFSRVPHSKIVDAFVDAVNQERHAIGYPNRCGKITYSANVRSLAMKAALLSGISLSALADASDVSLQTLKIWRKKSSSQVSQFRELKVTPEIKIKKSSEAFKYEKKNVEKCILEVVFPWRIRLAFDRNEEGERKFAIFVRTRS